MGCDASGVRFPEPGKQSTFGRCHPDRGEQPDVLLPCSGQHGVHNPASETIAFFGMVVAVIGVILGIVSGAI